MSLYNQFQLTGRDGGDAVSLAIVEKMVEKALSEKKLKNFQDFSLCLLISDKNTTTNEMLLDIPVEIFPAKIDFVKWRIQVLKQLNRHEDLISFAKEQSAQEPLLLEDWELLMLYLEACLATETPLAQVIFWDCTSFEKSNQKRAHYLFQIELLSKYKNCPEITIQAYFENFGDKESCFSDLLQYLPSLTDLDYFFKKLDLESSKCVSDANSRMRIINTIKIAKFLSQSCPETKIPDLMPASLITLSNEWTSSYSAACSDLVLLAVVGLMEEYNSRKENCILYECVDLLYREIAKNETNFYLKLVLLYVLRELGGISLALQRRF